MKDIDAHASDVSEEVDLKHHPDKLNRLAARQQLTLKVPFERVVSVETLCQCDYFSAILKGDLDVNKLDIPATIPA